MQLNKLQTETITIEHTELGRTRKRKADKISKSISSFEMDDLDKVSGALALAYAKRNQPAEST